MVKDGIVSVRAIREIENFKMSDRFGWTPDQIREMSAWDRAKYRAIMRGESRAKEAKKDG